MFCELVVKFSDNFIRSRLILTIDTLLLSKISVKTPLGFETEIRDKSKKILDDYLNGKSDYEPDIISSVISINAHFGSSKLFETYLDNMNNAKTPQDEVRFQRSLSLFQNELHEFDFDPK